MKLKSPTITDSQRRPGIAKKEATEVRERLKKREWKVLSVGLSIGRSLVEKNHYAKSASNTAVYLHGLFRKGDYRCWGVAWWIPPTKSAALATYPENWQGVLMLSRLVTIPEAPANSCSYLIGQSRRLIDRERWPCLVTYADEWQGHKGGIYLATNWSFVGRTKPEATYLLNGKLVARKAGPHTRTRAEMEELGARMIGYYAKRKFVDRR